jgi:hypothetical protein
VTLCERLLQFCCLAFVEVLAKVSDPLPRFS